MYLFIIGSIILLAIVIYCLVKSDTEKQKREDSMYKSIHNHHKSKGSSTRYTSTSTNKRSHKFSEGTPSQDFNTELLTYASMSDSGSNYESSYDSGCSTGFDGGSGDCGGGE